MPPTTLNSEEPVMPMESDKRIRVDKIRKNPAGAYRLSGVFRIVFILRRSCSAAATRRAKAPPHIQRGGASR